ncbi:hypothetical protein L596_022432 [Steinernema carpocapsae]|uniref:Uncharacterized protein n=1 Tax=Steinernema carpocapsae TaxID=34508 RepID=A0A4U5MLQ7_STECR|nr:hypothetical protein L596_022432 [Steinernema carpocapsae]
MAFIFGGKTIGGIAFLVRGKTRFSLEGKRGPHVSACLTEDRVSVTAHKKWSPPERTHSPTDVPRWSLAQAAAELQCSSTSTSSLTRFRSPRSALRRTPSSEEVVSRRSRKSIRGPAKKTKLSGSKSRRSRSRAVPEPAGVRS